MKTIYIVRHAKSSWENPLLPDEQRPLEEKGIKKTGKITGFLRTKEVKVNCMVSSHAVRALETAKILAKALQYPLGDIRIDPRIYSADGDGVFNLFCDLPEKAESVMIVGHNPALTDFVNHFLEPRIDNLPTSGVVSISFETDRWEDVAIAGYKVNFIIFPKIIGQHD